MLNFNIQTSVIAKKQDHSLLISTYKTCYLTFEMKFTLRWFLIISNNNILVWSVVINIRNVMYWHIICINSKG